MEGRKSGIYINQVFRLHLKNQERTHWEAPFTFRVSLEIPVAYAYEPTIQGDYLAGFNFKAVSLKVGDCIGQYINVLIPESLFSPASRPVDAA